MSDNTHTLTNSIWPNGMDVDSEGYALFYPLGTNKVDIPSNSPQWPKGDKLVSPFIYKNDKLVGFCDTKAMINNDNTVITMPYEHIEIELSNIDKGTLQIHAPKATTKKVVWKNSGMEDIADVDYKYKGCKTNVDVLAIGKDYYGNLADIASDGSWTKILSDLENCNANNHNGYGDLFYECTALTSFNSDLSSLTNGEFMFTNSRNLKTFEADLSSLTNGTYMFYYCTALTTFNSDLSSLTNGGGMFANCNFSVFDSDLSSLTNGGAMFSGCSNLTTFTSDLSSLADSKHMFYKCSNLTTFKSDLSSLTYGNDMFRDCSKLSTFESNLSSLMNGYEMFYKCSSLRTFDSMLSSLTEGRYMFQNCTNLTTFTSDLSSLSNGFSMFSGCSKLTTFTSDLSYLTNGETMFSGCKLDTASIKNISETIAILPSAGIASIHIGIGNTTPTKEEHTYLSEIHKKNWKVFVNGSSNAYVPATVTADETGEIQETPIPFYAKPESSTEETAKYIDSNGNFYNILGGQFIYVDDPETYGMFLNEEDAAANMGLTPFIKSETNNEN